MKPGIVENIRYIFTSIGIYTLIIMLFGAPFFQQILETVSLASLLTCFTTVPFIALDEISIQRIRTVYSSPNEPHEWFLVFLGYGTIVGTWASAGLLILDWDRPWQTESLSPLVDQLFDFLSQCSWIYAFRWIDPQYTKLAGTFWHPFLSHLPNEWKIFFVTSSFDDLKTLVIGGPHSTLCPSDLLSFADSCRRFTRLLFELTKLPPNSLRPGQDSCLVSNETTCDTYFRVQPTTFQPKHLGMTPKKSHEVAIMAELANYMLLGTKASLISAGNRGATISGTESPLSTAITQLELDDAEPVSELSRLRLLVDIGSGLGHLPNSVASKCTPHAATVCADHSTCAPLHVIAVDCDESLHRKAECSLRTRRAPTAPFCCSLERCVHRLLFRLDPTNVLQFKTKLNAFVQSLPCGASKSTDSGAYLLSGLHCCGDLSRATLHLFRVDPAARRLILVGCCYHKMALKEFPASTALRSARSAVLLDQFLTKAAFRLACQWSPEMWLHWTDYDFNKHRIRFIYRLMQSVCCPAKHTTLPRRRQQRFDPTSSTEVAAILDTGCAMSFGQIYSVLFQCLTRHCGCELMSNVSDSVINGLHQLWLATPGLLAIQQLVQPLLELTILLDRLLYIREEVNLKFSGLVRLFDPQLSPRCLALVACK
ncbi:unnamed protein product [Dicrocoelium dendriticum]|nr:unnamed protein product [Dicrocoelium dendriticum]